MQYKAVLIADASKHDHVKGALSAGIIVNVGDWYVYGATLYECVLAHTAGAGNYPPNTTYWTPVVSAGTPIGSVSWKGAWSSGTTYAAGDGCTLSGHAYVSIAGSNLNYTPPNATWWVEVYYSPAPSIDIHSLTAKSPAVVADELPLYSIADSANKKITLTTLIALVNANLAGLPIITDSVAWTPTGSWTTNTTYTGRWRRIGERAYYEVKITLSGAPTSASLTVNLPAGHTIDTTKLVDTSNLQAILGMGDDLDAGANRFLLVVKYNNTTSVLVGAPGSSGAYVDDNVQVTQIVPQTYANGDAIVLKFDVPIVGWTHNSG